jgi:hypothetical protein
MEWLYGRIWSVGEFVMNSLIDVFTMDLGYFESNVAISTEILNIMFGVGWALLLGKHRP